jgi:spore coat protein CotH
MLGRFGLPPDALAALAGGRGVAPSSAGRRLTPADVRSYGDATTLYDTSSLRTLFLQFDNPDWEKELADFYNSDVDIPATLTVDGRAYRDVGIHFRGMSSFMFAPPGSKRSLNLAIDFIDDDQRLLGYRSLNLLNVNGDPTFTRPLLYAEIARHYVPTPKANYVRVVINGENWGVYVNAQQFNSDFVNEWFSTRRGARWRVPGSPFGQGGMAYLGENADAYKSIYSIRTRDEATSWADLIRMFRTLNQTPADQLEAALAPMLDIDGALKFLALEVALVNSDGYWVRASDYSIYQDEKGRFHLIPHDMNEALAEETGMPGFPPPGGPAGFQPPPGFQPPAGLPPGGAPPGFPPGFQLPPMFGQASVELDPLVGLDDATKPLRSKLLAVPTLRARYLGYVREIAGRWLDWGTLEPLIRQYQSLIAEDVKADTRKLSTFDRFQSGVSADEESVKHFADRRRAFLLKAVARP